MKLKITIILVFILIMLIPISTYGITDQDNGKIKVSPVTTKNFEAIWMKGFDIKGYIAKDQNTKELISSTHNNLGYHIFLNVNNKYGEMNGKYTLPKEKMKDMHYKEVQKDKIQNIDGIELLVKTQYINNGNHLQIIYTLKNVTENTLNISVGTSADVEIDGDDKATIEKINNKEGIRLLTQKGKTKKKAQFTLYLKNAKGVTNVDNIWIGNWSDYYLRHIFDDNSNIEKIENRDSAITYSWVNREIKAGETKNYSVVMDIGEQNVPQIKIPIENNVKLYHSNVIINGTVEDKDLKDIITIHYSIDNKEYTLPPIHTEGKAKNFTLDLTKLNLLADKMHILKVWAVDSTETKGEIEERKFIITHSENPPEGTNTNIKEEAPSIKNENTSNTDTKIKEINKNINYKELEKDNTVANIKIPQTGENNNWILLAIIVLGIIAIKSYIKLKSIK